LKVTDEKTGDGRMLQPLDEEASKKGKVANRLDDGACDTKSNFRYLNRRGLSHASRCERTHPAGQEDACVESLQPKNTYTTLKPRNAIMAMGIDGWLNQPSHH
jgi:hypothetical protein